MADGRDFSDLPTRSVTGDERASAAGARTSGPDAPTDDRPGEGPGTYGQAQEPPSQDRFPSGTTLAGRYRIVAPLGAGGMGAVYRADDLTLNQPVALKFLPAAVARDPARIERLRREVRVGRKVSHPAVCRVYDIGEHAGEPFLSMEYVDGEDLASLLRRIGKLPRDKALEIVRQTCAGLAAAHDRGIVHRDLKPANIMLDGRGRVRISDFGLAAIADRITGREAGAGTPLYMAPEQLDGQEATARSDIYALGLIIFELFTGRRPHDAATFEEMRVVRRHAGSTTETILDQPDLEPAVARAIARCLDPDPARRPANAIAVAAMLPGGDPLAAALAAGETPSPDVVAGAGGAGRLHPALAIGTLALTILILVGHSVWASRHALSTYQPLDTPPIVMIHRAREVLRELGAPDRGADAAWGYTRLGHLGWTVEQGDHEAAERALREARPPTVMFWFRQTPRPWMLSREGNFGRGFVEAESPPRAIEDETYLSLDLEGNVRRFVRQPAAIQLDRPSPEPAAFDEAVLFRVCGLKPGDFQPATPRVEMGFRIDQRAAWSGHLPGRPDVPIVLEAGMTDGHLAWLSVLAPWEVDRLSRSVRSAPEGEGPPVTMGERIRAAFGPWLGRALFGVILTLLVVGAVIANRNLQSGRGDREGAFRFGLYAGVLMALARWMVAKDLSIGSRFELLEIFAWGMFMAMGAWSAYLAVEPIVRRRWPTVLIAWTRLLSGRPGDPLVGRSVLLGVAAGVFIGAGYRVGHSLALGDSPLDLATFPPMIMPWWVAVGTTAIYASVHVVLGMLFVLVFVGIRRVAKRPWLALVLMALILALFDESRSGQGEFRLMWGLLSGLTLATLYARVGVLAAVAYLFAANVTNQVPPVRDWSAWHATSAIIPAVAIGGVALWGAIAASFGRGASDEDLFDRMGSAASRPARSGSSRVP